jgi:hypothetical protein
MRKAIVAVLAVACGDAADASQPATDANVPETGIAGDHDLMLRVHLSQFPDDDQPGSGAVVRVENAAGDFVEATAGADGVAHPRVDPRKGPFDVSIAHVAIDHFLSILDVDGEATIGDVHLTRDGLTKRVKVHGTVTGTDPTHRVALDANNFGTKNLERGATSYDTICEKSRAPLRWLAFEYDPGTATIVNLVSATIPRPTAETTLDIVFPTPSAPIGRSTFDVRFPMSGVLRGDDLRLEKPASFALDVPSDGDVLLRVSRVGAVLAGIAKATRPLAGVSRIDVQSGQGEAATTCVMVPYSSGELSVMINVDLAGPAMVTVPPIDALELAGDTVADATFTASAPAWEHGFVQLTVATSKWLMFTHRAPKGTRGIPHLPTGFRAASLSDRFEVAVGVASDSISGKPPWIDPLGFARRMVSRVYPITKTGDR